MGYELSYHIDGYDFHKEKHFTTPETVEVDFGDVFDSVQILFGHHQEDWFSHLLDIINDENGDKQQILEIKCEDIDTGDGVIYLNVETDKNVFQMHIQPTDYEVDSKVSLEEIIENDNDKLYQEIYSKLGLGNTSIKDLIKSRKGEVVGNITV